jgi:ATP-binding cassette subfamily B (MDR/TAP) protein 1
MSAERQTRTIRRILFRSIIHKEMTYFDIHNTGELNTKLTDNVNTIHDGIGDKVGVVIQYMASCMVGFIIGNLKI